MKGKTMIHLSKTPNNFAREALIDHIEHHPVRKHTEHYY